MDVNEKDWKLFRKYLPDWQENYMEKHKPCKVRRPIGLCSIMIYVTVNSFVGGK